MKHLKSTKKQNPHARVIVVTLRVNAEEMKQLLARGAAYAGGSVSEWIRFASLNYKPKKEDFEK